MGTVFKDLKFGARALLKKPGSAVISVLVLALGIGLSTFMFSVVYGVFLRGLDTPQSEQLRTVSRSDASQPQQGLFSLPMHDYFDVLERQDALDPRSISPF